MVSAPDDGHTRSAVSLGQHALRLQVLLDRRVVGVLAAHGLSRAELDVLGALAERGGAGARPRELSSRLLITTGGLSNVLRRLQDDRLIEREPDPADARSHTVRLTAEGRRVARDAGSDAGQAIGQVLGVVDASVLRDAERILHRILVDLDEDAPVHRDPGWAG